MIFFRDAVIAILPRQMTLYGMEKSGVGSVTSSVWKISVYQNRRRR